MEMDGRMQIITTNYPEKLDKKTKVDQHIFVVPRDMSKLIIPFTVCQETGNGIIYVYS